MMCYLVKEQAQKCYEFCVQKPMMLVSFLWHLGQHKFDHINEEYTSKLKHNFCQLNFHMKL